MVPFLFGVPSTLRTGMGLLSGKVGMRCLMTNLESMNCPSAPESTRALAETFLSCTCKDNGMRKAVCDSSELST